MALPVFAVSLGATVLHASMATGISVNEGFGSLVALFTVAERYDRRVSAPAAIIMAGSFIGLTAAKVGLVGALTGMISTMLAVGVIWALGDWVRTRRRYTAAIEENARILEADRDERARRAVQDERERIARELHDIVTHHVSVIVIQAGAGLTGARPAARTGEVRARGDRPDQPPGADRHAPDARHPRATPSPTRRAPRASHMPGLARLGELIEEVRAAGLPSSSRSTASAGRSMTGSSCPPTASSRRR